MREEKPTVKFTIKDSVFTSLFREKKYLLQLYQTLHPEDEETREEDLTKLPCLALLGPTINETF